MMGPRAHMPRPRLAHVIFTVATALGAIGSMGAADPSIGRREVLQQSAVWFASTEARAIADRIVALQGPQGGWSNWSNEVGMMNRTAPIEEKNTIPQSLDDGATTVQLRILARVLTA